MELVNVGDVYVCSWGYDQTNVDFYKVTRKMKKSIKIVGIGKRVVENNVQSSLVVPELDHMFRKDCTKFPTDMNGKAVLRINSFSFADPWDGTPQRQTNPGWGH